MKQIVITGEKGGVGKSTISCLFTEWLIHQGHRVRLIDADPNETTQEWIDSCADEGRQISSPAINATYQVVDTAGRSGSGLKFLEKADIVLAPFQPLGPDVSRVITWFMALHPRYQEKVGFIPNRLRALGLTLEQKAGVKQIEKLIQHEGNGRLLPGLIDRLAVYPTLFDGLAENFFTLQRTESFARAQEEANVLFRKVSGLLDNSQ